MRKMTVEQARELRKNGIAFRDEQGKRVIPRAVPSAIPEEKSEPAPPPAAQPAEPAKDHTQAIIAMIRTNAETINKVQAVSASIVAVIDEMVKPKPPPPLKRWRCTVGRKDGEISTIDIVEK